MYMYTYTSCLDTFYKYTSIGGAILYRSHVECARKKKYRWTYLSDSHIWRVVALALILAKLGNRQSANTESPSRESFLQSSVLVWWESFAKEAIPKQELSNLRHREIGCNFATSERIRGIYKVCHTKFNTTCCITAIKPIKICITRIIWRRK